MYPTLESVPLTPLLQAVEGVPPPPPPPTTIAFGPGCNYTFVPPGNDDLKPPAPPPPP